MVQVCHMNNQGWIPAVVRRIKMTVIGIPDADSVQDPDPSAQEGGANYEEPNESGSYVSGSSSEPPSSPQVSSKKRYAIWHDDTVYWPTNDQEPPLCCYDTGIDYNDKRVFYACYTQEEVMWARRVRFVREQTLLQTGVRCAEGVRPPHPSSLCP